MLSACPGTLVSRPPALLTPQRGGAPGDCTEDAELRLQGPPGYRPLENGGDCCRAALGLGLWSLGASGRPSTPRDA